LDYNAFPKMLTGRNPAFKEKLQRLICRREELQRQHHELMAQARRLIAELRELQQEIRRLCET
jgi:uncharacterized coiled-coil DUF342 family protein